MTEDRTITVSTHLYRGCEQRIEGTSFESIDEYVEFVLSEALDPSLIDKGSETKRPDVDKEHLQSLGYLNE